MPTAAQPSQANADPRRPSQRSKRSSQRAKSSRKSNGTSRNTDDSTWGCGKTALGLAALASTAYAGRSLLPSTITQIAGNLISFLPSDITAGASWVSDALWDARSRATETLFSYGIPRIISFDQAADCTMAAGVLGGLAGYAYRSPGISNKELELAKEEAGEAKEAIVELSKILCEQVSCAQLLAEDTQHFFADTPRNHKAYRAFLGAREGERAHKLFSARRKE